MTIREQIEQMEKDTLSPYACLSVNSRGRDVNEPQCDIRPVFQRDRDRILHSKSFRRLKNKTQVFLTPKGDHYRTRMSHTLEVSQNARTIAKALRLNEDLVEAIALGHDLGHTPFGHAGERVLNRLTNGNFKHNEQSVRIVEKLEKDGEGLNLTWEVRNGILNHEMELRAATLEGRVVRISDKIAYMNADFDDGIRAQLLSEEDIPLALRKELGYSTKDRLDHMIHDIIICSMGKDDIFMSQATQEAFMELRKWMFANLYTNPIAKSEEVKAEAMIERLYYYYMDHIDFLPKKMLKMLENGAEKYRVVCDYISGMTDQYAITKFEEFYIPVAWQVDGY